MLCVSNTVSCVQYIVARVFCWSVSQQWRLQHPRPWGHWVNILIFTGRTFSLSFPETRNRRIPFWFRSGFVFACLPQSHHHVSYSFYHLPRCCFSLKTPLFFPPQQRLPRPHMAPTRKWKICFGVKDRGTIACGSSVSYLSISIP